MPCATFARASQNVVAVVALLDTLPAPSTDGVEKVYHQLRDILVVATEQQAEISLQRHAEVSVLSLGRSKASRQKDHDRTSRGGNCVFTGAGPVLSLTGPLEQSP
jgi:hypothetical protein